MTSSAAVPAGQIVLHRKALLARQGYGLQVMHAACYSTLTGAHGAGCAVASYLARARLEFLAVLSLDSAEADVRHPGRGRVRLVPKIASLASRCTKAPQVGACLRLQGGRAAYANASSRLDSAVVDAVCDTRALSGCSKASGSAPVRQ